MIESRLAELGRTMLAQAGVQADLVELGAARCPVGWCVPTTGEAAVVRIGDVLCERHQLTLSGPLLKALLRAHERGAPDLEALRREALIEARRRDKHWRPWGVAWRSHRGRWWHREHRGEGRVLEGLFDEREALCRASELDDQIGNYVREVWLLRTVGQPTSTWPWHGRRIASVTIRVWVAHEVLDASGQVVARGPSLASALSNARAIGCWYPARVRNRITGRAITVEEAHALLERERSAACSG